MGFSEYRDTVISGFNEVEELLLTVSVENYEMVMSEISALINPEKPYVSLADDLPFNVVDCNGNIFIVKKGNVSCIYGNTSW